MKKRRAPLGMRPPKTMPKQGRLGNKPKISSNKGMAIAQAAKS